MNFIQLRDFGTKNRKALRIAENDIEWPSSKELICGCCGARLMPSATHRKWDYEEHPDPPCGCDCDHGQTHESSVQQGPTAVLGGPFWCVLQYLGTLITFAA
jgi:hypothetical protein